MFCCLMQNIGHWCIPIYSFWALTSKPRRVVQEYVFVVRARRALGTSLRRTEATAPDMAGFRSERITVKL